MAPEQASGKNSEVDRSSDVYALGAILYELVTGKPPFKDARMMETIRQVLEDPVVPPSKLRAGISPEIESLILLALAKDKSRRLPTATAFAKALEAIIGKPATAGAIPVPSSAALPAVPAKPARSLAKVFFWAVVLIVLSALAGVGVLALLRGGSVPGK
jgi:serine/threonine protein kinase